MDAVSPRVEPVMPRPGAVQAMAGESAVFSGLDDPALLAFIREGYGTVTESGITVTPEQAMKNTTVFRCVSLISFAIGMLPLHLRWKATKEKASEHPAFRLLHRKPNDWQTAFEFRSLMQQWALIHGNAYARIVRSRGRIIQLVPMNPTQVTVEQKLLGGKLTYKYARADGGEVILQAQEVFHLRNGISPDGISGMSLVEKSAEAIALAIQTEKAAARLFKSGVIAGSVLKTPGKLSPEIRENLKASLEERRGAENAHKSMLLEEGLEFADVSGTGRDNQHLETRKHQIDEIARPYGVPRPLLGVDETSWGSGIDVLGQLFVRYALNPWFVAWEQAIERDILSDQEADEIEAKFNPGALLRGNAKDQAEFFAKALGSGGHQPWMSTDEIRELSDLPPGVELPAAPGQQDQEQQNEPS
ncbi:phage portal protein [Roseibium sp. RKSG952]|nr:phage portal protein [Roseibium sp. RKSG952]MTH96651.1 phage portal protein [Roseibium sp. RKSG952]